MSTIDEGLWRNVRVTIDGEHKYVRSIDDESYVICNLPVEFVQRKYEFIRKGEKVLLRGKEPGYTPAVATECGGVIKVRFTESYRWFVANLINNNDVDD